MTSHEERANTLVEGFAARFGPQPRVYRAPGRVNLIGEHTDYNGGFVLPAALTMSCWVAAAPRTDRVLSVWSDAFEQERTWDLSALATPPDGDWGDYVRGVAVTLMSNGYEIPGASLLVSSDVPLGAGLSSSAALEVAVALALIDLAGPAPAAGALAALCQRAENDFVGVQCGPMDQITSVHARADHALLIDCRSLEYTQQPIPGSLTIVACNTMVRHRNAGNDYNTRRRECAAALEQISRCSGPTDSFRDVDTDVVDRCNRHLDSRLLRRARHVVSENTRVMTAARALQRGDLEGVADLMAASHRSLRDDFEVSCPELDLLVELARQVPGVYGSRMTGAGFGGCTVNLVATDAIRAFREEVSTNYERRTGHRPEIYTSRAGAGAERVC
jgi:galactokinase